MKGRVLLAGDAAHANNPVGGMGLHTGILDAHVVAIALEKAVKKKLKAATAFEEHNTNRREALLGLMNPVSIDNVRHLYKK